MKLESFCRSTYSNFISSLSRSSTFSIVATSDWVRYSSCFRTRSLFSDSANCSHNVALELSCYFKLSIFWSHFLYAINHLKFWSILYFLIKFYISSTSYLASFSDALRSSNSLNNLSKSALFKTDPGGNYYFPKC